MVREAVIQFMGFLGRTGVIVQDAGQDGIVFLIQKDHGTRGSIHADGSQTIGRYIDLARFLQALFEGGHGGDFPTTRDLFGHAILIHERGGAGYDCPRPG